MQFSVITQFSSIWPIDLSGDSTLARSKSGSDGNGGICCITQSSSITEASPSDCLVPYPEHSCGGDLNPLQRCSQCILQLQPTGLGLERSSERHDRITLLCQNWGSICFLRLYSWDCSWGKLGKTSSFYLKETRRSIVIKKNIVLRMTLL